MTADGVTLGGRLPLYDREALEPGQKELFDWLMNKAVPWAEGAGFQAGIEGGAAHRTLQSCPTDPRHLEGVHGICARRARKHLVKSTRQGGRHFDRRRRLAGSVRALRPLRCWPPRRPLRRRGAHPRRGRAAKGSQRHRNGGTSRRACPVSRASSRRCTSIARQKSCSAPTGSWTPSYSPASITPCAQSSTHSRYPRRRKSSQRRQHLPHEARLTPAT